LGTAVRTRLGRWEIPAAELYRSAFINLDDLAASLASLGPVKRILEIGCGDGAMADRLCTAYPDSEYLGIDIAQSPGRLFRGDPSRATFRSISSSDLLAERPEPFDLVAIVDVIHHVADDLRAAVLRDAAELTASDGLLAVKEWERGRGLAHVMAYTADRYISGDNTVRFMEPAELRSLIRETVPSFSVVCEARIPPHRNNILLALRRR
jgi:2-polyprenyl-6-hydroxyphenyl methylase/3-demethylubiquinone-9 3-methyltransferase